jgi:hypothetical protein
LDPEGTVRELRSRLVDYLKGSQMDQSGDREIAQARVTSESVHNVLDRSPLPVTAGSHGGSDCVSVLVELLRGITPLSSEKPEEILWLFEKLGEVQALGLVDDRTFLVRILPLVTGSLLKFDGNCLIEQLSWVESRARLLADYFPYIVRERLIRDLIVFNFHAEHQPLRSYVEQIFQVANFLRYVATGSELVDRVLMNLQPSIQSMAAFVNKPTNRKELDQLIGQLEEKSVVAEERKRQEVEARPSEEVKVSPPGAFQGGLRRPEKGVSAQMRCWTCGVKGHVSWNCP